MLTADAVEARSELARHLRPSAFPAAKDELIAAARDENAPDHIISRLNDLPEGERFTNVQEAWTALGHEVESSDDRA